MPDLHILNLGCKVNRIEADTIAATLANHGARMVALNVAEIVLINTCTVTAEAAAKARKAVRRALGGAITTKVIVTGCAGAIDTESLEALGKKVIVEPDKSKACKLALKLLNLNDGVGQNSKSINATRFGEGYRLRPGIKVQDGCNTCCSYCIVPKARGAARSIALESVLAEAQDLLDVGASELVLSGINLGKYQDGNKDFFALLVALVDLLAQNSQTQLARIRLSSLEPDDITEELAAFLAQNQAQICAHLHLPLQSGSSKILKAMRRPYDATTYIDKIKLLRKYIPAIALSSDVIVGFPGETDADFRATMDICEQSGLTRLHVFRFSARAGTLAADMDNQVAPEVKKERAQVLGELGNKLAAADRKRRDGSVEDVLVVKPEQGLSASYHNIKINKTASVGNLIQMQLAMRGGTLEGRAIVNP